MKQKLQNGAGSGSIAQIRTNYSYNIQSWLTNIQAKDAKYNNNLLDIGLDYYEVAQGTSGQYGNKYVNGNISRMRWQVGLGDNQYYDFAYDVNNRLTGADYLNPVNTIKNYDAKYNYNSNGAITYIERYGLRYNNTYGQIDRLYQYVSSYTGQMYGISDYADIYKGHKKGNGYTYSSYSYDGNGNMTSDQSKNLNTVKYNNLNLPSSFSFSGSKSITIIYDATGRKWHERPIFS